MSILDKYLLLFARLNRATREGVKAPHKPILLLSVIQGIDAGEIQTNQICITPELVSRFKDNWKIYVSNTLFQPNFYLPFFHLRKEKFWHLKTYLGKEILLTGSASIGSFANLRETFEYAYLDNLLFDLLSFSSTRIVFIDFIKERYLDDKKVTKPEGILSQIENQILNDSPTEYRNHLQNSDEEDIFLRGAVFKKEIPRIYDSTCCISGMRIVSGFNIQMIDACHIIPFAFSHDDTVTNGISLSPNLHRAFDRGLISIDENYKVKVSEVFSENNSPNNLKSLDGKLMLLPKNKNYWPLIDNFKWHRENIFKL